MPQQQSGKNHGQNGPGPGVPPVRVVHVSDCYLPRTGGIETQVHGLAVAQQLAGHKPVVITATQPEPTSLNGNSTSADNSTIGTVPVVRLGVPLPYDLPITHRVGGSLRRAFGDDTDVVHVHAGLVSPFAWPALRTAVRAGLPTVVTVHSLWSQWSHAFALADAAVRWRSWPVAWTAVSEAAAGPLRHALRGHHDVDVLSNGIDLAYWRPTSAEASARRSRPADEVTVIAVGRMAARKRGQALVEVLADTRARLPEAVRMRAIIVGDGPERRTIERSLTRRGMDWVECTGWQTRDQIRAHFAESDIFISAGRLESFGIAALEARTFGLPVVALDASGVTEFVTDRQEGMLAGDDEGLADAVVRLVTDRRLLADITTYNTDIAPAYGWSTMVERTDEVYRRANELMAPRR